MEFEAEVYAGTYLRAFAHDLGQALGCGAHLHSLLRSSVGPFRVDDAITPAGLEAVGTAAAQRLIPMHTVPLGLSTLVLTAAGLHAIRHGRPCGLQEIVSPRPPLPLGPCCLQGPEGTLVAIGEVQVVPPAGPRLPAGRTRGRSDKMGPGAKGMRLLVWNVHKGIGGLDRRYRPERILEVLRHHGPDLSISERLVIRR